MFQLLWGGHLYSMLLWKSWGILYRLCLSEAQNANPHISSTSHNEPKECGDILWRRQEQNWQEMWRILWLCVRRGIRRSNHEGRQDEVCLSCNTACKWGWVWVFSCKAACLCLIVCVHIQAHVLLEAPHFWLAKETHTQSHVDKRYTMSGLQCILL